MAESTHPNPAYTPPRRWWPLVSSLLALTAACVVSAAFLPGCFAKNIHVRPGMLVVRPEISPRGVLGALPGLLRGDIDLEATVLVRNDNLIDFTLQNVKWKAFLRGREIGAGTVTPNQLLPADREEPVSILASVHAAALGLAAIDMVRVRTVDIAIEVDAEVKALGMTFQRHERLTGFDLRMDSGGFNPLGVSTPLAVTP